MRNIALVLLAAFQTLSGALWSFGQDKPVTVETIERINLATAPIVCGSVRKDGTFDIAAIMGSAFFINDDGEFVTAGHVVKDFEAALASQSKCFPAIYLPDGGWDAFNVRVHWFRFVTCIKDQSKDIAVCKPVANPFVDENVKRQISVVTFGHALSLKDGTALAFTGFPLGIIRPVTSKGNLATYLEAESMIVIDKAAWPGASGSPVYLSDGKVIGVLIQRGIENSSGLAFARPVEMLLSFLSENKIRFQQK